jgi:hypothetical protein
MKDTELKKLYARTVGAWKRNEERWCRWVTPIPDAWVAVDSHRRLAIEIKTPQAFNEAGAAIPFEGAVEVIERHVMRAGSSRGGQILQDRPGVVVGKVATLDDAVAAFNPTERIIAQTIIRVRP